MKKGLILLSSALMTLGTLSGCGNSSTTDSVVESMIDGLRNGFKLESDVSLTAVPYDEVYDNVYQTYHANYIFQNDDEMVATRQQIVVEEEDGTSYVAMNDLLKQGEDGSGYFLDLTYENEIIETQAIDDKGAVANFGLYYGNPFAYITEDDFTKIDDSKYSLSKEKASFISSRLFGALDDIFYALIEETTFHIENGKLTKINLKPFDVDTQIQMGYENVECIIDANVDMRISEIGTAKVDAPTKKVAKAEHAPLASALSAVNRNYTLIVKEEIESTSLLTGAYSSDSYESHFYFADDYLFWRPGYLADYPEYDPAVDAVVKFNSDNSVTGYGLDEATNTWTTAALFANGLSAVNSNKVTDFVPVVSEIAAEVFNYDAENDIYTIVPELVAYIGVDCFIPLITAAQTKELWGNGTDCSIKLENGAIKEIVINYYFNNQFNEISGTFTLEYSNIGTTTLPSDIVLA